jgi:hypothetical protein
VIQETQRFTSEDLKKHLVARDGHAGRTGAEAKSLARHMKLSVHTIQSIALGRRSTSDRNWSKIGRWVANRG